MGPQLWYAPADVSRMINPALSTVFKTPFLDPLSLATWCVVLGGWVHCRY